MREKDVDVELVVKPKRLLHVEVERNVKLRETVLNVRIPFIVFSVIIKVCPFNKNCVCNSVMNVSEL